MTIELSTTTSPQRKIIKTLSNTITREIQLKDDNNVCTPTVLLTYVRNIDRYNYAYIPALHRYYWIDSITEMVGGICALSLKVDVLMTYKPDILDAYLMLKRKTTDGIGMIPDSQLPLMPYKDLKVIKFESEPFFSKDLTRYSPCYVLAVGGR